MYPKNKRDVIIFLFMLICVSLAGELKIHPFDGAFAQFQVSLGSPVFLLFILSIHNASFTFIGVCMGIFVVIFRAAIDVYTGGINFGQAVWLHVATFFYYFVYAGFFSIPKFNHVCIYDKALQIAGWSILAEVAASVAELSATCIALSGLWQFLTPAMIVKITLIAILRCFFILSFFFLAQIYTMEVRMKQERREKESMLMLVTDVYNEVVQLNESQKNAEETTRECYKIYEELQAHAKNEPEKNLAQKVLNIAGTLHDIKKDNQRVYAGLMAITNNRDKKLDEFLPIKAIAELSVNLHKKYAKSLAKEIAFRVRLNGDIPPLHVYTLLSMVNNIMSNAVEAVNKTGTIRLFVSREEDMLRILITNTGSFIAANRLGLVFQPGYTTKFDSKGNASTGVGLSYVKNHVERLGGSITINSDGIDSVECTLQIPLKKLAKG